MTQAEFIQKLNQVAPTEVVNMPEVKKKYVDLYNSIWKEGGEAVYNREARYFNEVLTNLINQSKNPQLMAQQMDRFSVYNAIVESAITNLSLEPGVRALAYLTTRNRKEVDANGREVWVNMLKFAVSGYGEMVTRIRCGQIRHADNPVVVYANDELTVRDVDGKKNVEYVCHFPHINQPIVACYLRITRADGSIDYAMMYEEDWLRLAGYSDKQNRGKNDTRAAGMAANQLYRSNGGQIDPGFLQAKLIKHAFKIYPKVKIGAMTIMSEEEDDAMNLMQHQEQEEQQFGGTPWDDGTSGNALGTVVGPTAELLGTVTEEQVINPNDEIF